MRVLIVDDSRVMRAYVRGVLAQACDCSPTEARSGFEALRLLPRESFDLIVTDINMPDINGLELIRFVRGSERHARVPILIISTQTTERDQERVIALGADRFLSKPFDPEALVEAVEALIGTPREGGVGGAS